MQRILILSLLLMTSYTLHAAGAGIYIEKYDYNLTPKKGVQEVVVTFHRIGSDFYDRTVYRFDHKGFLFYRYVFDYNKAGDIVKISGRYNETDAGVAQKGIADYATIEYK